MLLSLGSSVTACGRTAAALRGWGLLVEPSRTVEVAVPHGHGRRNASRVRVRRRRRLAREQVQVLVGTHVVWVTTAVQTAVDLALELPLVEAVVAVDSALRSRQVRLRELRLQVGRQRGRRDAARLARTLALCDPESGSVLESVLRVRLHQAGVAGFSTQAQLGTGPGQSLRVDFCFEQQRLVVETDGARWHEDVLRDRERDNALAALGWRVLRFTWRDVVDEWRTTVALITQALDRESAQFVQTRGAAV